MFFLSEESSLSSSVSNSPDKTVTQKKNYPEKSSSPEIKSTQKKNYPEKSSSPEVKSTQKQLNQPPGPISAVFHKGAIRESAEKNRIEECDVCGRIVPSEQMHLHKTEHELSSQDTNPYEEDHKHFAQYQERSPHFPNDVTDRQIPVKKVVPKKPKRPAEVIERKELPPPSTPIIFNHRAKTEDSCHICREEFIYNAKFCSYCGSRRQ